jgi:hypothetical protein
MDDKTPCALTMPSPAPEGCCAVSPSRAPAPLSDTTEYQHSMFCALTLPRSKQPERVYRRDYQGWSLLLEAGHIYDGHDFLPQPLPYGPKARLAFMHICSEAVRTQSPFVEMERSARAFMNKIGITNAGNQYRLFRQQMMALSACRMTLGYRNADGTVATHESKPIKTFEAWVTDDEGHPALWASTLTLQQAFFDDLLEHAVPLSGTAIRALSHSALALDAYGFLAYRLHALANPVIITDAQLHAQMGQEYRTLKDFKKEFTPAMRAALEVYPDAKVERIKGGFLLKPSRPPISPKSVAVSRGLADKVKTSLPASPPELPALPVPPRTLKPRTIETFRQRYPRLDVYACEADFKHWLETQAPTQPRSYDAAFLGFAKKWCTANPS